MAWGPVLLSLLGRLALAVALVAALMRWVLPWLIAAMARSQELLLVFALAWGTTLALAQRFAPQAAVELLHVYTVPFEEKLRFAGVGDEVIAGYR